jgi:hypothetical protein
MLKKRDDITHARGEDGQSASKQEEGTETS